MSLKKDCLKLVRLAIDAVNPARLVENNLRLSNENELLIANQTHVYLNKNVYVAAIGKAVLPMCEVIDCLLSKHIVKGIGVLPIGSNIHNFDQTRIKLYQGAKNNLPDNDSFMAAQEVYKMCSELQESDILIALISGGGSALLPYPVDGITLDDKLATIKLLASRGATINELNLVRTCLSKTKGGGLAKCAFPAKVISLIISDVIGDPLDIIASGPTFINSLVDPLKFNNALEVLHKFCLIDKIPISVSNYLKSQLGKNDAKDENLYQSVNNFIIGNNQVSIEAIQKELTHKGDFKPIILTNRLQGEAKEYGKIFAYLAHYLSTKRKNDNYYRKYLSTCDFNILQEFIKLCSRNFEDKKLCILSGGETTVDLLDGQMTNESKGGRNQEMVLSFKIALKEIKAEDGLNSEIAKIFFTSFGTDGIDGPTDAAGALVETPFENENDNNFIEKCLKEHNSYSYFDKINSLIKIGHTGTNVADIQILLIEFI